MMSSIFVRKVIITIFECGMFISKSDSINYFLLSEKLSIRLFLNNIHPVVMKFWDVTMRGFAEKMDRLNFCKNPKSKFLDCL